MAEAPPSLRERLGLAPPPPGRPALVDAHHHLWDLAAVPYPWLTDAINPGFMFGDYAALRRDYPPVRFLADSAGQRVVATVHCEAEASRDAALAETRWLDAQHARCGFPNALVVWADLGSPTLEADLDAHLAASRLVRGVRCKPRLPASPGDALAGLPGGLDDPAWLAGLDILARRGLSWDLRVPWWALEAAAGACTRRPGLVIVLNHCGLPWDRSGPALARWRRGMRALAACPNVAVKLSELGLPDASFDPAREGAILREVLDMFGPGRCLFASNFPVAGLRVGYDDWVAAVEGAVASCTAQERDGVLRANAARLYRIPLDQDTGGMAVPLEGRTS